MDIAVFLDVDKTLTQNYIQQEYATALGCEAEYLQIESELQHKQIDETEFGEKIISLFANRKFTKDKAREFFSRVKLQPWTAELLNLEGVQKYLVSSGPSYYIDSLADRFGIPKERVRRSLYKFDDETGLISSCDAVSPGQKAQFVEERSGKYSISIGIGDNSEFDGPFVSHCTIPLLTEQKYGYIYIADLNSAVLLIGKLARKQGFTDTPNNEFQDPKKLTIVELWNSLRIETWVFLAGLFGGAGAVIEKLANHSSK